MPEPLLGLETDRPAMRSVRGLPAGVLRAAGDAAQWEVRGRRYTGAQGALLRTSPAEMSQDCC